jgi:hypothetical protein
MSKIGVAMGAGAALAMETADVTLLDSNLEKLEYSIAMGQRVIRKIQENIIFSLAVKFTVLGFTLVGRTHLWAAIASDVGAMIVVTLNSMMLLPSRQKSADVVALKNDVEKGINIRTGAARQHSASTMDADIGSETVILKSTGCKQTNCCSKNLVVSPQKSSLSKHGKDTSNCASSKGCDRGIEPVIEKGTGCEKNCCPSSKHKQVHSEGASHCSSSKGSDRGIEPVVVKSTGCEKSCSSKNPVGPNSDCPSSKHSHDHSKGASHCSSSKGCDHGIGIEADVKNKGCEKNCCSKNTVVPKGSEHTSPQKFPLSKQNHEHSKDASHCASSNGCDHDIGIEPVVVKSTGCEKNCCTNPVGPKDSGNTSPQKGSSSKHDHDHSKHGSHCASK